MPNTPSDALRYSVDIRLACYHNDEPSIAREAQYAAIEAKT
jgi:hypothetical protein